MTDSGLILKYVSEQPAPESVFFLVYTEKMISVYLGWRVVISFLFNKGRGMPVEVHYNFNAPSLHLSAFHSGRF